MTDDLGSLFVGDNCPAFLEDDKTLLCYYFDPDIGYSELFVLSLIILGIQAGSWLTVMPLSGSLVRAAQRAREGGVQGLKNNQGGETDILTELVRDPQGFGGFSLQTYIYFCALQSALGIAIKITAVELSSMENINDNFDDFAFEDFLTPAVMVNVALLSVGVSVSRQMMRLISLKAEVEGTPRSPLYFFFALDCLLSFVLFCVKYSTLVVSLYGAAVGIVVGLMLCVGFICTAIGAAIMYFIYAAVCFPLCCCKMMTVNSADQSPLDRFKMMIFNGVFENLFAFLLLTLAFLFMWLFLGGINQPSWVILHEDQDSEMTVAALLLTSVCLAAAYLFAGLVKMMLNK